MKKKKSRNTKIEKQPEQQKDKENSLFINEFVKMFNHCKYNLVALNKKFDALDVFLKNYLKNEQIESEEIKNDRLKYHTRSKSKEKEDIFPISNEDLDFITRNFIEDEKQEKSERKKPRTNNIITIKKKDLLLDENIDEFFNKKEEEKNMDVVESLLQNENFVQKLFDYKAFSSQIESTPKTLKEKELKIEENADASKWIQKCDDKPASSEQTDNIISPPDLTLSLADNFPEKNENSNEPLSKFDKLESNNKTNYSAFTDYLQTIKMNLRQRPSNQQNKEKTQKIEEQKYGMEVRSLNEEEFYTVKKQPQLNKKQQRSKKKECPACKKIVNDDSTPSKCNKCFTKEDSD